jgi:hypothetical protein
VSASSAVKWAQQWHGTGHLEAGKVGGHKRVILESERDTLWRFLRRHGKEQQTKRSLMKPQNRAALDQSIDTLSVPPIVN